MTTAGHGRGTLALIGAFIVLAALITPTRSSAGSPPARAARPAPHASPAPAVPAERPPDPGSSPSGRPSRRGAPEDVPQDVPQDVPDATSRPRTRHTRSLWPDGQPETRPSPRPRPTAVSGGNPLPDGCPSPASAPVRHAPGPGRTVALTFDDGPSRYTPELLDLLRRERVHATFFVVGGNAASAPDVVARTAREGHLLGDHTWHHAYPTAVRGGWTRSYLRGEMGSTRRVIISATGGATCWFRPPAGFLTPVVLRTSRELGYSIALWSVDTRDWQLQSSAHESGGLVTRKIAARAAEGLAQQNPVILMHDGGGHRRAGIDAVAQIIHTYRAHGYRFVRLDGRS